MNSKSLITLLVNCSLIFLLFFIAYGLHANSEFCRGAFCFRPGEFRYLMSGALLIFSADMLFQAIRSYCAKASIALNEIIILLPLALLILLAGTLAWNHAAPMSTTTSLQFSLIFTAFSAWVFLRVWTVLNSKREG